jgi:hypothetical protein
LPRFWSEGTVNVTLSYLQNFLLGEFISMISVNQTQNLYPLGVGGGVGAFGLCRQERTLLSFHRALLIGIDLQTPLEFCKKLPC